MVCWRCWRGRPVVSGGNGGGRRRRRPRGAGGFYDAALTEAERAELPAAKKLDGLDEEIALVRLRLRSALEQHPENVTVMMKGIELLVKALSARYKLTKDDKTELSERMRQTLLEIGGQMYPEAFGDGAGDDN
jgi:hypothetical protein